MEKKSFLQDQQVRLLYQQSPFLLVSIIGLAAIVDWFFLDRVPVSVLTSWTMMVLGLSLLRLLLIRRFQRRTKDSMLLPWAYAFVITVLLSGMSWGALPLFILDPQQADELTLVVLMLTGMCTGGLVPLAIFLPAFFSFLTTTLLPLAYVVWQRGGDSYEVIPWMLLLYMISLFGFSLAVHRNILDSIKLRFENSELLDSLRRQKEIAEKANIDKSRFLAATSHDLRQPLHALDLYLESLQMKLTRKDHQALLQKASKSSQTLADLLNALMDISRLDAQAIVANPVHFDLAVLTTSIVEEFYGEAGHRQIELKTNLQEALIYTDPMLLGRIVRNLISNAIKHSTAGQIVVSIQHTPLHVELMVEDNGRGIAADELEKIFSEFYQMDNPERDREKGLGLGLAIVKRLCELLDIKIDVRSEPGQGACFSLTLALDEEDITKPRQQRENAEFDVSGKLIFAVDDEMVIRDALKILLRSWDCEVLIAESGEQLMNEVVTQGYPVPDLIISDYRLQHHVTGLDVVSTVRSHFAQAIPAIIITGDSSRSLNEKAHEQSCVLLLKPLQAGALRHEMNRLLSV